MKPDTSERRKATAAPLFGRLAAQPSARKGSWRGLIIAVIVIMLAGTGAFVWTANQLGVRQPGDELVLPAPVEPKGEYGLAVSPDGSKLLSGSLDGTARLWDMVAGEETAQFSGHDGPIYAVAFGPNGTVITGGIDRAIRIWPAAGGEEVALIPGAPE